MYRSVGVYIGVFDCICMYACMHAMCTIYSLHGSCLEIICFALICTFFNGENIAFTIKLNDDDKLKAKFTPNE